MIQEFKKFITAFESQASVLFKDMNVAYFNATITGSDGDYKKWEELSITLNNLYADRVAFERLEEFRAPGAITDPLLRRELDVLYNAYLGRQIDNGLLEAMIKLRTAVEKRFNTFRANVGGNILTDNEIEDTLRTCTDSETLQKTWEASKLVGAEVADDVLSLVDMRNRAARNLGFSNFHAMQLSLGEQDPHQIESLFDGLDALTRGAFAQVKDEMDAVLAQRYGLTKDRLMPWHYQNRFFQEGVALYPVDLDGYYRGKDLVEITRRYYDGLGLNVDAIVANSDLYERPGKDQHAYSNDIDKAGDVRVLCNVKPDCGWMNTLLHEFGHAVYDRYKDFSLPWTLRDPSHIFTTEAIAMLFGRFSSNPAWLRDEVGVMEAEEKRITTDCLKTLRLQQLVFSRWAQVMYRFEKRLYENPSCDLNALWWDLVEQYQLLRRPPGRNAPDWAAKIHVATVPAYYHNYLMGEMLASQLQYFIARSVLCVRGDPAAQSYTGKKEVGAYLKEQIFMPANRYPWNELIKRATGEELTPRYFALQFVNE